MVSQRKNGQSVGSAACATSSISAANRFSIDGEAILSPHLALFYSPLGLAHQALRQQLGQVRVQRPRTHPVLSTGLSFDRLQNAVSM